MRNSRGILSFSLSPYEQKAFAGFLTKVRFFILFIGALTGQSVKNTAKRLTETAPFMAPGVAAVVLIYTVYYFLLLAPSGLICKFQLANSNFQKRMRKNPADYANDV